MQPHTFPWAIHCLILNCLAWPYAIIFMNLQRHAVIDVLKHLWSGGPHGGQGQEMTLLVFFALFRIMVSWFPPRCWPPFSVRIWPATDIHPCWFLSQKCVYALFLYLCSLLWTTSLGYSRSTAMFPMVLGATTSIAGMASS
jgi:hypothetical protein